MYDAVEVSTHPRAVRTSRWQYSNKLKQRVLRSLLYVVLSALGFTFLVPLLWVMTTSLKISSQVFVLPIQWIPSDPQWQNYVFIFDKMPMMRFAYNTLIVAGLSTIGAVFSASVVAFSLARLRWPGRNVIFTLVLATMMLPGIVTLVPTFIIFTKLHWVNTFLPLIVPSWFGGGAFYIFLLRQFMVSLPNELEEAARIDGAGSFRIFWKIVLPLSRPAMAAVAIFSFLDRYNDFLGPLIYLNSNNKFTLSLGLYWLAGRYGSHWPDVMAASLVTIVPVIVLFFLAQRQFIQGIQLSGLAGR